MHQAIVPPNKLTRSEKMLYFGYIVLVVCLALLAVAAFLHEPLIVGGIAVLLLWREGVKRQRDPGATSGIHGTGHFASADEVASAGFSGQSDGLILGTLPPGTRPKGLFALQVARASIRDTSKVRALFYHLVFKQESSRRYILPNLLRLPCTDKMSHVACYMPSGVGKTLVVISNLLSSDENVVVYDPSGESFRETAEWRRKQFGHEIRLLDPFGVCGQVTCDRVNVLDTIGPDDSGVFDYSNNLAHALVVENQNSHQDPFWHKGSVSCTAFALHAIARNANGKFRSLASLGELLNDKRLHEVAKSYDNHPDDALRRGAQHMLNFQGKTLQSLLACTSAEHAWMNSPAFSQVLSDSTFDVRNLQRHKMSLFVVIPGHRVIESRPFLRTILTAILYHAFEAGPDIRRPTLRFYLDECATLGANLDVLMALYTQGRKFGLRSVNFFQSVSQVAEIAGGPDKVQNFRAQMAAELWKPKDFASAKEVSDWVGNMTVRTTGTSWQQGSNSGWSISQGSQCSQSRSGSTSESTTTTINETGVLAIRPEEILQLREREAIFVSAGTPPIKVNVIQAPEVREFRDLTTQRKHQKRYLFRVRCYAAVLLLVAPLVTVAALRLVIIGAEQWSGPAIMTNGPQATAPFDWGEHPLEEAGRFNRTTLPREIVSPQRQW